MTLYRTLVEGLKDVLLWFDREGHHLCVSENVTSVFSLESCQYYGKTHRELGFSVDFCLMWESALREVWDTGKSCERECSMEGKQGLNRLSLRFVPERDETGRIQSVLTICRPIGLPCSSMEKMEETRFYLNKAQEMGRIGHFSYDPLSGKIEGSDQLFRIFGIDPGQSLFTVFADAIHPEDRNLFYPCIDKAVKQGIPYDTEYRVCHTNGNVLWIHARGEMITTPQGRRLVSIVQDITERKHAEKKLAENERKLKETQEMAHLGYWDWDIKTGAVEWSEEVYKIFHLDPETFTPNINSILELSPWPEDHKRDRELIDRAIKNHEPGFYEQKFLYPDKTAGYYYSNFQGRYNKKGELLSIIGTVMDITERKKAEEALQYQKDRLSYILEGTNAGTWEWNIQTGETLFNERWAEIIGYTLEEISPLSVKTWIKFCHPDDLKGSDLALERHFSGEKEFYEFECRMKHKDGHWVWILDRGKVISWTEDGKPLWMYGTHQDISKRKQAEEALLKEKELFRVTLRSIGDGVITTDTRGSVLLMNNVAEKYTGWKQEEAQGLPLETVFCIRDGNTGKPCENPALKILESGKVMELGEHTLLISREGTERRIADSGAPIKDNSDKMIGVVLVFRDITEKQKIEDAFFRSAKLDALGVLAGGIAHDFNNLLGGILGNIDFALHVSDPRESALCLENSLETISHARRLTNQLLTFSKGGAPLKTREQLKPFLEENVRFALSGSNVNCGFDITEDLWNCDIDKNQIAQAIDNIVLNAKQAMPAGGTLKVTARNFIADPKLHPGLKNNKYVQISLTDTGTGIPRKIRDRIFDPFFSTKAQGHGLGLATCHSIIQQHGGFIEVESETGGSTFHLFLPASLEIPVQNEGSVSDSHHGSGTFLVMDDEPLICRLACSMLNSMGYTAVSRPNGEEALAFYRRELAANRKIAGMLFDLTVQGGMGGKEAVAEIRKIDRNIPVFVASGYADDPVIANPVPHGFTASLCKPFLRKDLAKILSRYMPVENPDSLSR